MSTIANPRVSVVMPVYNGGHYFELALQSALAQTYDNLEIVVVNDGSTDAGVTDEIGRRYAAARPDVVRYIPQDNGGVASALNTGIERMTGDIFCWLSHDDLFEPDKTAKQVEFFRRVGRKDAILFSDYYLIDPQGEVLHEVRMPGEMFRKSPSVPVLRGAVNGCTIFIPRGVLPSSRPFEEQYRYSQDYWLWHGLLQSHEFFHAPGLLVRYRLHPGQDTHKPAATAEGEALWRHMVDSCTEVQRVQMYGSTWRFFDETFKIIDPSPYKDMARYLAERRDGCLSGTLVSVIIPFFNEVELLKRAVSSVQRQTHAHWEIILVDDGSTEPLDELHPLMAQDPRVRLIHQANAGPGAARNFGLREARGEYIAFLDGDDEFLATKLEDQLRAMSLSGQVFSHTSYLLGHADDTGPLSVAEAGLFNGQVYPTILENCPVHTSTVMLHRGLVAEGFRFPPAHLCEDVVAWIEAAKAHAVLGINEALTLVERAPGTAAIDSRKGSEGLAYLVRRLQADPVHSRFPAKLASLNAAREYVEGLYRAGRPTPAAPRDEEACARQHETLLARAWKAFEGARYDGARDVLDRALRLADTASARRLDALLHRLAGDYPGELASAKRAVAFFPDGAPPEHRQVLAEALVHNGQVGEAVPIFRSILPSGMALTPYQLASCLAYLGRFEEADRLFEADHRVPLGNGGNTGTRMLTFSGARAVAPREPVLPYRRTVSFDAQAVRSAADGAELVNLICCDQAYFDLFAGAAAAALARNAAMRASLHVHVVNPGPGFRGSVERVRASVDVPVTWSSEFVDLSGFSEGQRKVYYSCARFLLMPTFLQAVGSTTVLLTDADQLVVAPVERLVRPMRTHDVGLMVWRSEAANVLSLISASVILARPTSRAIGFFQRIAAYLADRLVDGEHCDWHLDQAALAVGFLTSSGVPILELDPEIMQSRPLDETGQVSLSGREVFWSVTYSVPSSTAKLGSGLFQNFASPPDVGTAQENPQ